MKLFVKKYLGLALFVVCLMILTSLIELIDIYIKQRIIDLIILQKMNINFLMIALVITIIFYILKVFTTFMRENYISKVSMYLYMKVMNGSISNNFFGNKYIDLEAVLSNDLKIIIKDYFGEILNLIAFTIFIAAAYIYSFSISYYISLYSIIFMIIGFIYSQKGGIFVSKLIDKKSRSLAIFLHFIDNINQNFKSIKVYVLNEKIIEMIKENNEVYLNDNLNIKKRLALYDTLNASIYVFQKIGIVVIAGIVLYQQKITAGQFVSVIFLASILSSPIIKITNSVLKIHSTNKLRMKISPLIDLDTINTVYIDGDIVIKNSEIKYGDTIILKDLDLRFELGKKYLILGKNGSGKSTLLNVIISEIIKNSDSRKLNYGMNLGILMQKDSVLDGLVKDNLTLFYTKDCDDEGMQKILSKLSLTKELEYNISKKSKNISGGEIQRLLLARLLYKKSKFLVLDEPFSSIPKEQSEDLLNDIFTYSNTVILVSHHIEKYYLKKFDYVLLIKGGKVFVSESEDKEKLYAEYIEEK